MEAFPLQSFEGLLCFLPGNFRGIFSSEKLNCCLNVRNAAVSAQGAAQQFQLPCVERDFSRSGKGTPQSSNPHSSKAAIRLWQKRSAQVTPHNLAQAARSPQYHAPLRGVSRATSKNPEQHLPYEHTIRPFTIWARTRTVTTGIYASDT